MSQYLRSTACAHAGTAPLRPVGHGSTVKQKSRMSARTYLCTPCRWSRRAEAAYGLNTSLRCPTCGGSLWELEWRWRIPRKNDDKGWKELDAKVAVESAEWIPKRRAAGVAKMAKLEGQIATIERLPDSAKKTARLKRLRNQHSQVSNRYA